jgi:PAS domain S-box-containing protein
VPEQREHGEHAAVVVLGGGEAELLEDRLHVALDGARAQEELVRDRPVRAALGDQRKHVALALGELVEGGATVTTDKALHDVWVERRSATGDALDGADELRHVADPVFEQIADSGGVVTDELEHVGGLEVLGEDEHCDSGVGAPDLRCRDEPVVCVPGWHLHVHDRDVGRVGTHFQQQVVGVAAATDDRVTGVLEEGGDPFTQESIVVGHHDAQWPRGSFPFAFGGYSVVRDDRVLLRLMIADTRVLQLVEHETARILAETEAPVDVYAATLEAIGHSLGWQVGAVWEMGPDDELLHCVCSWHALQSAPELLALSERLALAPGEGLPGRVLSTGEPAWIVDAPNDGNFPRAHAARRSGLHAAFGFPLRSPRGIVGVMEFFSRELREPDQRLLETMRMLGSQVGQFVARRQAEAEVRASESRLRAMLAAALDAVVTMDHRGRVLGWNQAAEAIFGYRAHEAVGCDMADLIVPPSLRSAHRKGLERFLETEQAVVLDRRLELIGLHKNGTEFPVELTITRIGLPGPPTFTGYLRDITDRKRAEAELRASRARLVEVGDVERRRIQRNLHDGAQQRLTSVLLSLGRLRENADGDTALLDLAIDELATGLQELRELASGLHPSVLSERGFVPALEALALRAPVPVELAAVPDHRLPEQVEVGAYYVVAEALANVHKHADARRIVVRATVDDAGLLVEVADDGAGGADPGGEGLRGLVDRVEALGGTLELDSATGRGTRVTARLPLR